MKISLFKSLRFKMPVVVLMGVVPLMSVAIFFASDRGIKAIRKEGEENLALKANLLSEGVSRWNEMNVLALQNLSEQPDIVTMNPARQKPLLVKLVDNYEHFYLAMTIAPDGVNIARNDNVKPKYYGDRNYFQNALKGQPISYQTLIGRTSKQLALCMAAPIATASQPVGVTVICTDLNAVAEQVGKLKFGETGYAFVVDSDGNVLAHPDPEYISGDELRNLTDYSPVKNIQQENGQQKLTFTDDRGIKWFSYSERLNNGWSIVVLQEEYEFLSNERQFRTIAFIIAGTAILGTIAITFILANRLIEPISNLTSAAIKISDGQLEQKLEIKRQDELGILAQSFNEMTNRLTDFFNILNKQIDDRSLEAERAKQATEVAQKNRDKLLNNISGELQISLKSMLDFTTILQNETNLVPRQARVLNIIEQNGTYLLTLINDILDFSTTDAVDIKLEPKNFHLPSFLEEVLAAVEPWGADKSLQIKTQIDSQLPTGIKADKKRLRQVLINLLSNAIKFTFQGGVKLKISAIETTQEQSNLQGLQQKLRFEIIDTGVGMTPDRLKKLFLPLDGDEDNRSKSIIEGFSLTISREILNLMGGELKARSQLGVGSTFWFDLVFPVVEIADYKQNNGSKILEIVGYEGKTRKILIADDKEEDRLSIASIIKPLGFEAILVNDGRQMLEIAPNIKPDLILIDLYMPVKSGFTSAKELREIPELNQVPIIALSRNNAMTEKFCKYLGCQDLLKKPLDRDELLSLLQQYLGLNWLYEEISSYPEQMAQTI